MDTHPQYVAEDNAIEMIIGIDRSNFDYNGCHCTCLTSSLDSDIPVAES
jgi:hypothetical protein